MSSLINRIASDEILEQAFEWLCKKRKDYHFNADVWQLRRSWSEKKVLIQKLLRTGKFKFRELKLVKTRDKVIEWWHSIDALVLKAISIVFRDHLSPHLSSRCFHLSGTGGIYGACFNGSS